MNIKDRVCLQENAHWLTPHHKYTCSLAVVVGVRDYLVDKENIWKFNIYVGYTTIQDCRCIFHMANVRIVRQNVFTVAGAVRGRW